MDFFTITSEMTQDLKLKGNNLLIYAVIYNYSKNGNGLCTASRSYIANLIGASSVRTVDKSFDYLQKRGLIVKNDYFEHNTHFVSYKVLNTTNENLKNLYVYLLQEFTGTSKDMFFNGLEWNSPNEIKLKINMYKKDFPENWAKIIDRQMNFWNIQKKKSIKLIYGFKEIAL